MASYRAFCSSLGLTTSPALLTDVYLTPGNHLASQDSILKGRLILTQCLLDSIHSPHEQKERRVWQSWLYIPDSWPEKRDRHSYVPAEHYIA